ncbi:MAG TPA: PQQ-dependent dehydrogenase, methanol/ethanol family [Acetobacteraceae bacterium]|nr:PQQ-dependent dehydrogenase, methanol/ethanol family [Acetobacteraceae bacterium]
MSATRVGACGFLVLWLYGAPELARGASAKIASPVRAIGAGANWTARNADSDETAYSRLDQIDHADIKRLGLAWSLDLPGEVSLEATPLAIDGVLYFTGSYASVYAVDGVSGKLLWTYAPETWKHDPMKMVYGFAANRGVAYADGRIFSAALDGRLIALDAKTGKLLWSVETTGPQSMQTITGAPRTFDGKVIIGNAGADFGARGYVTAYDQATGKQVWRFYTVPGSPEQNRGDPAMERAAATWHGDYWKTGTGGVVWDSITFDAALNHIYIGTGNGGPYDPEVRSPGGGDNLYTASIVALDANTGKYVWHYQLNPRDSWDFDATDQMTLADLVIDGKHRQVLMQAPKNGFFYVLDRTNGKLISAEKYGKVTWASSIDRKTGRPVEAANIRYETGESTIFPGPTGAHSWMSQSFDPKTGLVYIPYMQSGVRFTKGKPQPGGVFVAGLGIKEYESDPLDGKGALLAWDPVSQRQVWKAQLITLWNGGAMATAGDLVFQGAADGNLYAYSATTGARLWKFYAGMGIIAAPMSFAVHGKQYISILAGYGASAAIWGSLMNVGWKFASPRRLLTFALDGTAVLPPSPPRNMAIHPLDNPALKLNPADVAAGHAMFMACAPCHGRDLVAAGGPAPDLRESQIALDPDSFWHVVHDGALMQNGMPRYPSFTRQQVMQIYAYIRAGAREALAKGSTASGTRAAGH